MSVPVPFKIASTLLLLALPGVWLLARALTCSITRDRSLRTVLPLGLGLCLWLSLVHAASMVAGSLGVGLPIATLILAAIGVLVEWRGRRSGARSPGKGRRPSRFLWISMAMSAATLAPAVLGFRFHDELSLTGHMSIAAELQNRVYPPRHLALPDVLLRYHYGFDLLSACLTALLHIQVDQAIDVATLLLWCLSWCLLWVLGERISGRTGAWITPSLALFAGGAPLACDRPGPSVWDNVIVECGVGNRSVNAPVLSYFFQHPWGLGIPVAATAALLLTERRPRSKGSRLFALWLALTLLSLSEIALFAAVLPALVVAEAWYEDAIEIQRGAELLVVAALALGAGKLAGGFFAHVPAGVPFRMTIHAGFADDAVSTLVWNAKTFGALLPLGVAGLLLLKRGRALFGSLAIGGILVVNGVRFAGTEDIMKFATVASIGLGILGSVALARLIRRVTFIRVAAFAVLALSATGASLAFLLVLARDLPVIPIALRRSPDLLSPEEIEAMAFVRSRAKAGELVYHGKRGINGWAEWGGLPVPERAWTDAVFGLPIERLAARELLLERLPPEVEAYRAQGFVWFVLGADDPMIRSRTDAWVDEGTARDVAHFGSLRVVKLTPR